MPKVRDLWATEYHDVVVITIAAAKGTDCAFSADTDMAECIIVATKGKGDNTGRGKFICLNQRPQSLLEAFEITNRIIRSNGTYRLEDTPSGGDAMKIGEEPLGHTLDCPLPKDEGWVATRVKSMALLGCVKFLAAIRRAVHHILTTQQHAAKQRSQNLRHINKNFTVTRFK